MMRIVWHYSSMRKKQARMSISFPTHEDKRMVEEKAQAQGKSVSAIVLQYFKALPWDKKN